MSHYVPPTKMMPKPGHNVFFTFTCPENDAELLTVAVCGVLHIARGDCVQSYSDGKLTLMFHFRRYVNAEKASERMGVMIKYFATATQDIELTPAEDLIPGQRYREVLPDGSHRVVYGGEKDRREK